MFSKIMNKFSFKKTGIAFLLFTILVMLSPLKAQDQPGNNVWSLQQCIQYATKNNVAVMQSDLTVQTSENNYLQSKVSRLPSVNANASQALNWGRSSNPFTNEFVNQRINSNNFSLSGQVILFDGFNVTNTIKQNQLLVEANRLDASQSRYDVSLNVAISYLNILLNKELLAVAEQNVLSTREQLDRTQKLFDAGAIAEKDVIDLKATLANNELAVVNAKNQVDLAKVNLQQFMNFPISDNFDVQSVPIESLNVTEFAETPEAIYNTAESTQPSVRSSDIRIQSSEYSIELAKAGRYPTLSLNGVLFTGYSSATPNSDFFNQLSNNFRQQVSLNLSIPIFNRWQVKNNINNSILNKRISELTAKNTRLQLRQNIEQAYANAKAALNTYQAREKQVEATELAFETNKRRYEAGASNIVDFNLARINRDNARSDMVRAKYDYLFRKKVLDFYQNKPLDFD